MRSCAIRPQSLIGEQYVDCDPGTSNAPALARITHGPGTGSHFLPVTHSSSPIDSDIVQDISTEPVRQSLAVLIDEFGTGLAAQRLGSQRGHPPCQSRARRHRQGAPDPRPPGSRARAAGTDSDAVLRPLARERQQLAGFVTQANTTGVASAQRAADISKYVPACSPRFCGSYGH